MARMILRKSPRFILLFVLALALAEAASIGAQKAGWTPHDLAFYLDKNMLDFIRPGLVVKITSATIQDSKITVRFKLTDPKGVPLDRDGVETPGPITTSFIAAYIPKDTTLYTAYTTRTQTSPITNKAAVQAGTDSGGTYTKIATGEYTYSFRTTVPATYDPSLTHSIGVYSRRDLTEFDLGRQVDDDVFTFVPNGSAVAVKRDVVRTETCNKCHDPLSAHGGPRLTVELCILCHQPQTVDPDTGRSQDFTELVHKIHRGRNLPSVQAGTPYIIIGNQQSVHDYSTVAFPGDLRRCDTCHTAASQAKIYMTEPSRRACGACHDTVNFATGENHVDLPQVSDNLCSTCHITQGELEFDVSILGAHTIPEYSAQLPGTNFELVKVDNAGPGKKPSVTFRVKDKAGNVIDATKMNRVALTLAGPTTDYKTYFNESAIASTAAGNDFVYNFNNAIPADAKGTFVIAIEGYKNITLNAGTRKEMVVRDSGVNKMLYFSVDGSKVTPRRTVVSTAKCNACHGDLSIHGGNRRGDVQYCATCHNPVMTDVARRTKPELLPAESINFKTMVHKIHTGHQLTSDLTIYGYGNTAHNYNEVGYPGDRRNCAACHEGTSYQIPLAEGLLASVAPRDYINPMQPETGACLSCHTQKYVAAHALTNTSTALGEACATCHGPNAEKSVVRAHAR